MHQETELKFVGTEDALATLRQSTLLQQLAGGRRAKTLVRRAIYFDSEDHLLRKAGYVLRVRNEGNGFSQTLKKLGNGDVVTRPEFKSEVSDVAPELEAIPDSRVRWRIIHLLKDKPLAPVFEVDTRRTKLVLTRGKSLALEAAFDTGEIRLSRKPGESVPVSEFEVELVRGSADELFSVARQLTENLPLVLSVLSKADRGFRLARGEANAAFTSHGVKLSPAGSADDAVASIISEALHHMLNNVEVVRAGLAEGIHQMRVALRKLRIAISMLHPEQRVALASISSEARDIARVLGEGRDLDVLLTDITYPVARSLGKDEEFSHLVHLIEAKREACHASIVELINSEKFRSFVIGVAAVTYQRPWLSIASEHGTMEADAGAFARRQVERRNRQVHRAIRKAGKLKAADVHELRIRLKKLRYTLDFFRSVLPARRAGRLLRLVTKLQSLLGDMNDAAIARAFIRDQLRAQEAGEDTPQLAFAGGVVIGWHGRRSIERRARARRLLKKLKRRKAI